MLRAAMRREHRARISDGISRHQRRRIDGNSRSGQRHQRSDRRQSRIELAAAGQSKHKQTMPMCMTGSLWMWRVGFGRVAVRMPFMPVCRMPDVRSVNVTPARCIGMSMARNTAPLRVREHRNSDHRNEQQAKHNRPPTREFSWGGEDVSTAVSDPVECVQRQRRSLKPRKLSVKSG